MQARDQEGSELSRAPGLCLWGEPQCIVTTECKNSKAPDAFFTLKTGSELLRTLFVVLCASGIITNRTWEAAFPPADGSISLEATGTASLRVMALAPLQLKTLLPQDASLFILFHGILFYLKVWVSASSDSCLKSQQQGDRNEPVSLSSRTFWSA